MVVVADKILRIIGPTGRPSTTAELSKLSLKEKELERQLRDVKGTRATDEAAQRAEIRKLEDALKAVQKAMEPLKKQLEELNKQEEKEAAVRAAARSVASNPYAPILRTDLTKLGEG
ncbi:MAG: hypothetical protein AB1698_16455 [Pseudomonadota bacterium]|nr:hypothetical protein [Hyphomicrobiales bacterium]